jgi:hypothetical protein
MRTKQEVINFLESKVGGGVECKGNPSLNSQCVTLIKSLMEFLGVKDPYKARGHAKTCISAYLSEGIADKGAGFISVFSNKEMGDGYGHIWCNAGDGNGTYYESNGQKALTVTKGKTYSYDSVCNFDQYINLTESQNTQETITQEQWQIERDERNKNWQLYQDQLEVVKKLKIEIESLNKTITEIKLNQDKEVISLRKSHSEFVENLLTILNGSNPLGLSSEELVVKLVQEAISKETSLQAEIKALQQTTDKEKAELIKENKELKGELERLQNEFVDMEKKHEAEIDLFKKRLDNVQAQFEENQEEVIKVDSFKTFIEALIRIFKKG